MVNGVKSLFKADIYYTIQKAVSTLIDQLFVVSSSAGHGAMERSKARLISIQEFAFI